MKKAILTALLLLVLCSLTSASAAAQGRPMFMRNPTLSGTHIGFSYAGDLWTVSREGGDATRLTTGIGDETRPMFSPDGSTIAFSGEYDGNVDVFTVPASGGTPRRVTYHPASDVLVGWSRDGSRLLFGSGRDAYSRNSRLFTIGKKGGFPEALPFPMSYYGDYSPDASRIAYEPLPRAFTSWKRYRGGRTSTIWIARLSDSSVEEIPRDNSNDFEPVWIGDTVYFLSDRKGPVTLFSYDTRNKRVSELVRNDGLDIKSASAGPGAIVYEQFGSLHLYELKSGKSQQVPVNISADLIAQRPRFEKVGERISNAGISPSGVRAVFEARGEIITVPAEKGGPRNLTNSSGTAERDPAWSPDGRWIAYFSDQSGEYALHISDQSGLGEVRKINLGNPPSFFYSPTWSPDSKKIAFTDKRLNFWYVDIAQGAPVKVDSSTRGTSGMSWSPDSRWLTYTKPLESWYSVVYVYSLEDTRSTQITDGLSDAEHAVFDKNGKYLYFSASTDIGPRIFGFDMSSYPHRPTRSVYVTVLRNDLPSPLAPESDEEKVAEPKMEESASGESAGASDQGSAQVRIDFENIGQRILALPISARSVQGLAAGKADTLFVLESAQGGGGATLSKYDLEERKLDKIAEGLRGLDISSNGDKILCQQRNGWFIGSANQPLKPGDGKLRTEEMQVHVEPLAEWTQMFRETWRIERDFFYDPNHHGLDLSNAEEKYLVYLRSLADRSDLNYLFQEMLGELSVGHLYVRGGDMEDPDRVPGGLLGADYTIENGRYRFATVYNGENWNPNLRAPLTQPGVNVVAGEYLLAVNARDLTASDNLYSFFEATANQQVVITVGPNPDGSGSRDVTVVPVANERGLRNLAWIEDNRRKVDELSNGRLAYVYLPDTAGGGYTAFNRYFFSQLDKDGAVIDERFNGGGQAADYIIDYLSKPLMSYWAVRDGEDFRQPFGTMAGPKVMLINQFAGSGGDYMPYMFRRAGIGPLIGKRTWGGLVGIGGYPGLIDGGSVTAPHFAFYTPEGEWEIKNHGVAPDIEVELDPKAWREGHDSQLEKGVQVLLEELQKNPPKPHRRPAYPNYHPQPPTPPAGRRAPN